MDSTGGPAFPRGGISVTSSLAEEYIGITSRE